MADAKTAAQHSLITGEHRLTTAEHRAIHRDFTAKWQRARLDAASPAAACEAYFALRQKMGHCQCLQDVNVAADLTTAQAGQQPRTRELKRIPGRGGVALLLRGEAYRGIRKRREAQAACSQSVREALIDPLVQRGMRVGVFVTTYDAAPRLLRYNVSELYAPYAEHVCSVTLLRSGTGGQLVTVANALSAFLAHCVQTDDAYDTVVLTRFDLKFKPGFHRLLSERLQRLHGIRFLWREIRAGWRAAIATSRPVPPGSARTYDYFDPRRWRRVARVPDTLHAFEFGYTRCMYSAVRLEMTRWWEKQRGSAPRRVVHADMHRTAMLLAPALSTDPDALGAANGTNVLGYLVEDGAYDSNACLGGATIHTTPCAHAQPNPVYDILPRHRGMAGLCQREEEFVYDGVSQSRCCPAPGYCCPNSVSNCTGSDKRAVFYRGT